jgi:plasmid maintenance system antidote protein VapI
MPSNLPCPSNHGTSPELWLNRQTDYDIQIAKRQIGKDLARIAPISTMAGSQAY